MRLHYRLVIAVWLLATALAWGQTNTQPADPQTSGAQPTNLQVKPAPTKQEADPKAVKPSAVAAAASASRLTHQSAPPSKVIRNHDLNAGSNPPDTSKSEPAVNDAVLQVARDEAVAEEKRKVDQFAIQGKAFQDQVKVQKSKIIDLQDRVQDLRNQFDAWSISHRHVDSAVCWTSEHETELYKSWCDIGRNLKDATEATQRQLAEEKIQLEETQENIRRAGYGNSIYDPD
jgi:hypothetical protein